MLFYPVSWSFRTVTSSTTDMEMFSNTYIVFAMTGLLIKEQSD